MLGVALRCVTWHCLALLSSACIDFDWLGFVLLCLALLGLVLGLVDGIAKKILKRI